MGGWLLLMCGACLLVAICVDGGGVVVLGPMVHLHRFSALLLICPGGGPRLFDRVVLGGWLLLMCGACLLIAICVDGGGVLVLGPMVHLHRFSALFLICPGDRATHFFDRIVVGGWLLLMCGACFLIAIRVDGGGVVVLKPMVHLHRFSALLLICPGDRAALV